MRIQSAVRMQRGRRRAAGIREAAVNAVKSRPREYLDLLQARGVISVQERASYIGRVRDLAKGSCEKWMEVNGWAA